MSHLTKAQEALAEALTDAFAPSNKVRPWDHSGEDIKARAFAYAARVEEHLQGLGYSFAALAQPSPNPTAAGGFVLVPVEPTPEMLLARWPSYHPWGVNAPPPEDRPEMYAEMVEKTKALWATLLASRPSIGEPVPGAGRNARQAQVAEWCAAAFGAEHQASVPQRGLRMLEEAIEAFQATSGDRAVAHKLIDYIFDKEPGELRQELGGLGITVLALAAAAGLSADDAEAAELARVLSKPLAWFHARNEVKNKAGFDATAYPSAASTQEGEAP
jgi:NTP pyrophosphatase (non-canonical NTP hydrolase)